MCQDFRSNASPRGCPGRPAPGQPGPFAHLVADRLAGAAQVADDLAGGEFGAARGVRGEELDRQLGGPGAPALSIRQYAGRQLQPQVQADIDDHPDGPAQLRLEIAQARARVAQVAELVHQPFGVQCPALGHRADRDGGLIGRQLPGQGGPGAELQVVAWHALVVPGADQFPEREPGLAHDGQPGTAGPGEVARGPGVVRRGRAARRGDPRLHRLDRGGQVEVGAVELGDPLVEHTLQPLPDLRHAVDRFA